MKYILLVKWLAVGLTALSFAGSADAVTNAPNAAHKATLERDIGLLNTGKTVNVSYLLSEAWRMIDALEKSGDRSLLPYFAEISLVAANPETVRSLAAAAYVKSATAEECTTFLPKIFAIGNEEKSAGGWRNKVTPAGLAKIDAAIAKHELSDESVSRFMNALLTFAQSTDNSWELKNADDFLSNHCEGYPTSKQRVAMWHTIVATGNEWSKEKYAPLSESLEAIPPRKRVDLRKRFPNLPPLPEDKNAGRPLTVTLAIVSAFVAVCVAIWIAAKRMKTQTREKE
ncbi:MAG: hypothetical protein WCP12_18155 [bacterium]